MSSRGGVQLEVNRRRLTALYPTLLGLHWRETNGPRTLGMVSTPLAGFSRLCDPACGWRFPPGSPAKADVFAGSPVSLVLWRGVFISRKPYGEVIGGGTAERLLPSPGSYCPTFDLLVDQWDRSSRWSSAQVANSHPQMSDCSESLRCSGWPQSVVRPVEGILREIQPESDNLDLKHPPQKLLLPIRVVSG